MDGEECIKCKEERREQEKRKEDDWGQSCEMPITEKKHKGTNEDGSLSKSKSEWDSMDSLQKRNYERGQAWQNLLEEHREVATWND